MMSRYLKILVIDKNYVFPVNRKDFIRALEAAQVVNVQNLDNNEIKLYPDVSWGTMTTQGLSLVEGINVRATTCALDANRLRINFRTSVRVEHFMLIVIFIFFIIMIVAANGMSANLIVIGGLWAICHCWFQFIYRLQEKKVISKVVRKLELAEI
jgi:hypothetical protein